MLLSPDWRLEIPAVNVRVETSRGKRLLIFVNYSVQSSKTINISKHSYNQWREMVCVEITA